MFQVTVTNKKIGKKCKLTSISWLILLSRVRTYKQKELQWSSRKKRKTALMKKMKIFYTNQNISIKKRLAYTYIHKDTHI